MALREPFPLAWPEGWARTKYRSRARFTASYPSARNDVRESLRKMRGANVVITSNTPLNSNGVPDGRGSNPSDPGVAVWWQEKGGVERVIACDRWFTPAENLRAIAKTLEALRGIDRWGASQIVERAFAGFTALPAGGETHVEPDWWETLEIDGALLETLDGEDLKAIVESRYRKLAKATHPDHGGNADQFATVSRAVELARAYCENK